MDHSAENYLMRQVYVRDLSTREALSVCAECVSSSSPTR